METIRTVVHEGRISIDIAANLPEGTEVEVQIQPISAQASSALADECPVDAEAWIQAMNALEPLIFTDEERAEWEAAKAERKAWETKHFFDHADRLQRDLS